MSHPSVVAALASYRLSAELLEDARLLWENGRVPRAGALAVFSLEADAKANEWIHDVTGITAPTRGDPHRRRIEAGLTSLAAMFEEQLDAILGTEAGSLSHETVWDLRQSALYVDVRNGQLLTPERVTQDRAASVIAIATNVVTNRMLLGTDADLLSEFFADYGDAYRVHVVPILDEIGMEVWRGAAARLEDTLSERWILPDDELRVLRRRDL